MILQSINKEIFYLYQKGSLKLEVSVTDIIEINACLRADHMSAHCSPQIGSLAVGMSSDDNNLNPLRKLLMNLFDSQRQHVINS